MYQMKFYTLNAIIGVITNWLPHEKPINRFLSPDLSIAFSNYRKSFFQQNIYLNTRNTLIFRLIPNDLVLMVSLYRYLCDFEAFLLIEAVIKFNKIWETGNTIIVENTAIDIMKFKSSNRNCCKNIRLIGISV